MFENLFFIQAAKNAAAGATGDDSADKSKINKRHAPITFDTSPPKARANDNRNSRQPYVVPTGKFSANVSHSGRSLNKLVSIFLNLMLPFFFQYTDSRPRGRGGYRGGRGFRRGGY